MHKKIFFRSALALVISYFMLVGVLYQNKVSEARRLPETTTPGCIQGIKNIRIRGNCRSRNVARGFRQANFECLGGGRGELRSRGCVSMESFKEAAKESCSRMSNCRVSPSPSPTVQPCQERPSCLDEDPACLIPEPESGWCIPQPVEEITATPTPAEEIPTPTICAMPTLPFCEAGTTAVESDVPNGPGVCGFAFICASSTPTQAVE